MAIIDKLFQSVTACLEASCEAARHDVMHVPQDDPLAFDRAFICIADHALIINGVILSHMVLEQLRHHGINPQWCTPYELLAAEQSAKIDCNVFDDPDGTDFFDDLELTQEEKEGQKGEDCLPYCMGLHVSLNDKLDNNLPVLAFYDAEKKRHYEKTTNDSSQRNDSYDN